MRNREFGLALRLAYDLSPHSEAGEAVWEVMRKYAPDITGGDAPGQTVSHTVQKVGTSVGGVHPQGGPTIPPVKPPAQ